MSAFFPVQSRRNPINRLASPIRLMLVDDSIVARTVMARMLEQRPEFEVAALATTADQALALLGDLEIDVILLDLEMPGRHGLAALPDLIAHSRGARVLIVSSAAGNGAAATIRALTLGAADTLLKPEAARFNARFADVLAERLLRIGLALHSARDGNHVAGTAPTDAAMFTARIECLAIGSSTGGVNALNAFFGALPPTCRAPILITQHLPAVFMPYFAAQVQETSGRAAQVARDGAALAAGEIMVAPGDGHLRIERVRDTPRVRIDRRPAPSGCLPSVDPMFSSVAEIFGPTAIGVVLSGMGRDGLLGAGVLARAGGEVLAQDEASSVVWGMPGAVANAGFATAVLAPDRIAGRIARRAGDSAWT